MIRKERNIWLFFLIGGLLVWQIIIPSQVQVSQNSSNYGPDFFPTLLAIIVVIISGASFLGTFIKKPESDSDEATKSQDSGNVWIGIVVFLITVGYVFIAELIGFIPASLISMLLIMLLLSVKKWYFYLIMIVFIIAVHYIFENILYIRLP